jgi:hypothetical protein
LNSNAAQSQNGNSNNSAQGSGGTGNATNSPMSSLTAFMNSVSGATPTPFNSPMGKLDGPRYGSVVCCSRGLFVFFLFVCWLVLNLSVHYFCLWHSFCDL